jgi:protein involved in polysaccharide export with SLBB domain
LVYRTYSLVHAMMLGVALLWVFSAGSPAAAQSGDNIYKLGPDDTLFIGVFGEDDLTGEFRVNGTGTLNYPFLGELAVQGFSVAELEMLITNGLRGPYLVDPVVTVSIKTYRSFFVNGEVKRPGGFPYQPGLTVQAAVALAGGFTERASQSKIEVARTTDQGVITISIRLKERVEPDDIITVPQSFF